MSEQEHTVLAFIPQNLHDDLQHATDAYAIEVAFGRPRDIALNYATAVYVERQPDMLAWDARALIRAAIKENL